MNYFIITTTNHIYIGAVSIISGLIGGSNGFGLSIILRSELASPGLITSSSLQYHPNPLDPPMNPDIIYTAPIYL